MQQLIPLKMMSQGQTGKVDQLMGRVDDVHRLEELGLRRGTRVEMVQAGTPCIIRLSGHKLCFRDNDLFNVLVDVEEAT